jgi:hypothetical protein
LKVASAGATRTPRSAIQVAFIDNGDGVLPAMPANVAFNLVCVTLLSRLDFPIAIVLMAAKNW